MRVSSDVQISQVLDPKMSKMLMDANSSLWEFLYLTKEFEDVVNQKSMDLEDLFSQIGGSVGIMLGFSMTQIPVLFLFGVHTIARFFKHMTGKEVNGLMKNKAGQLNMSDKDVPKSVAHKAKCLEVYLKLLCPCNQ